MYHTGLDPLTGAKVYVAKDPYEKKLQRALLQYRDPKNRRLVLEALQKAGRRDLIGCGEKCLVRPPQNFAPAGRDGPRGKKTRALPPGRGKGGKKLRKLPAR